MRGSRPGYCGSLPEMCIRDRWSLDVPAKVLGLIWMAAGIAYYLVLHYGLRRDVELDVEGSTVGIAPVGCTVTSYDFYGCDMIEAAHGRAPAVATAVKRALPDGEEGAICVTGLKEAYPPGLFVGYYRDEERTLSLIHI